ncbi:DUF4259 domain-containing protein [Nonomuraea sp. NPDC059023]|uniref:DUF4259 domain-containing protein n=1 Tax=unclassified Nonomuraea TaxID=2593643 RepID=UPI0036778202
MEREALVGTWGPGPFDSDYAADFIDELHRADPDIQLVLVRELLERMAGSRGRFDEGAEAVAAAALIAGQCPGGGQYASADGALEGPLVEFPDELRVLAVEALSRALDEGSGMSAGWVDRDDAAAWRAEVEQIRALLNPAG